jgi:heat shock protein HslJ
MIRSLIETKLRRRNMKKITSLTIFFLLALLLTACGGSNAIVGTTWQWEVFQDTADINSITVPDPENYTLTLNKDGTASIQADCNLVTWSYELDGSQLSFDTTGPATLAMCAESSLDQQFLERLGYTVTFVIEDGKLYLNLFADAGNLVFQAE